jgi:hypothetical protein
MKRIVLLAFTVTLAGCARGGDHPVSPNCEWTEGQPSTEPGDAADRLHLRYDAITAEDVAIRWADKYAGPGSEQFKGFPEYGRRQNECMEALFNGIASHHRVDVAEMPRPVNPTVMRLVV